MRMGAQRNRQHPGRREAHHHGRYRRLLALGSFSVPRQEFGFTPFAIGFSGIRLSLCKPPCQHSWRGSTSRFQISRRSRRRRLAEFFSNPNMGLKSQEKLTFVGTEEFPCSTLCSLCLSRKGRAAPSNNNKHELNDLFRTCGQNPNFRHNILHHLKTIREERAAVGNGQNERGLWPTCAIQPQIG